MFGAVVGATAVVEAVVVAALPKTPHKLPDTSKNMFPRPHSLDRT
jgi:hypothetical protein